MRVSPFVAVHPVPGRARRALAAAGVATLVAAGAGRAAADDCEAWLHPEGTVRTVQANPFDSPPMLPMAPRTGVARAASPRLPISGGAMKMTTTVNGVTFDSNFDNGSLFSVASAGADTFNLGLFTEDNIDGLGASSYNFRFRMTGIAGRSVTLNINHSQSPRPAVSFDGARTWSRLPAAAAPAGKILLTFAITTASCELAFFEPLGYQECRDRVTDLVTRSASGATTSVLGLSKQSREQWYVRVTDPAVADAGKKSVWLHARAHAGEVTANHSMLGFLDQVTTSTPLGRHLRRHCIFHIVPTQNVDGVFLGLTRWDSQGIDPERQWPNPARIPEVANIKAKVDQIMASPNPILVCLNLHSTVGNYSDSFFFKHLQPSVTAAFELFQQDYIDSFAAASPVFDNAAPGGSQLSPTLFIESYMWNVYGAGVMAMTHEGHYFWRTGSGGTIPVTGGDYRLAGMGMAEGLVDHLNLPPVGAAVDDWALYR